MEGHLLAVMRTPQPVLAAAVCLWPLAWRGRRRSAGGHGI